MIDAETGHSIAFDSLHLPSSETPEEVLTYKLLLCACQLREFARPKMHLGLFLKLSL